MSGAVLGANVRAVNKHRNSCPHGTYTLVGETDRQEHTRVKQTEGWWHVREKDKAGKTGSAGRPQAFMLSLLTLTWGGGWIPACLKGSMLPTDPAP